MSLLNYTDEEKDYAAPANDNEEKAYSESLSDTDFLMLWFYDLDTEIMSYDLPI